MTELFPNFQNDPSQFALATQFWKELWVSACPSTAWQTGWLNTTMRDGTPFMDGDGILNAINRTERRALKVIQRPAQEASEVHTWSTSSEFEGSPLQLTVVSGPLTENSCEAFRAEFQKLFRQPPLSG